MIDPANVDSTTAFVTSTQRALRQQREHCLRPREAVVTVLADLLEQANGTAFGREHGLAGVTTVREWKRAIPVRSYEGLRPYVERIISGDRQTLTRSEPFGFLKTSGTSNAPKLVPSTLHWRRRYRGPGLYAQFGHYFDVLGLDRIVPRSVFDLSWEPAPATETAGGLPVFSITRRPESMGGTDWTPPWYNDDWFRDSEPDYSESLYRRARLLADAPVQLIVCVNPSKALALAETLGTETDRFIDEVASGTISGQLHRLLRPDPDRACRLEAARRAHQDGRLRIRDLWPTLALLVSWRSASTRLYQSWLDEALPGVPIVPYIAGSTEGFAAIPIDENPAGPLAVNQGLYEFIPHVIGEPHELPPDIETLDYDQVESGRTYRLVMSQANGLYRYDTGDVYEIAGWRDALPRLEFVGRAEFHSSFSGEKICEGDVTTAVVAGLGSEWSQRPFFTCVPVWNKPPGYLLLIEGSGLEGDTPPQLVAARIDDELQLTNVEYAEKRRTGRLRPLSVARVRRRSFMQISHHRSTSGGVASAQIKHHWLQRNDQILKLVDELDLWAGDRPEI